MISNGNRVKFARFVLLAVSEDFHACMVDRADIEKVVEDKDSQTQKGRRRWQSSCLLIKWKRKNWENLRKKKFAQTSKTF